MDHYKPEEEEENVPKEWLGFWLELSIRACLKVSSKDRRVIVTRVKDSFIGVLYSISIEHLKKKVISNWHNIHTNYD